LKIWITLRTCKRYIERIGNETNNDAQFRLLLRTSKDWQQHDTREEHEEYACWVMTQTDNDRYHASTYS
jgi:hypothetical protein